MSKAPIIKASIADAIMPLKPSRYGDWVDAPDNLNMKIYWELNSLLIRGIEDWESLQNSEVKALPINVEGLSDKERKGLQQRVYRIGSKLAAEYKASDFKEVPFHKPPNKNATLKISTQFRGDQLLAWFRMEEKRD